MQPGRQAGNPNS